MSIPPPGQGSQDPLGSPELPATAPADPPRYAPPVYAPPTDAAPGSAPPAYAPPRYAPPSYAPPSYAPPSYAAPGYAVPGYQPHNYAQPGGFAVPGPGEPFDGAASPADLTRPLYGANPAQALARFFKNYASFSGRASRSEYWWGALWWLVGWVIFGTMTNLLESLRTATSYGPGYTYEGFYTSLALIIFVTVLGLVIPQLAITWRRLHDSDLPGALFFIVLFPVLGHCVLFILLALPPKVSGRRFARE